MAQLVCCVDLFFRMPYRRRRRYRRRYPHRVSVGKYKRFKKIRRGNANYKNRPMTRYLGAVLPDSVLVKMNAATQVEFTFIGGTPFIYSLKLNSIADPFGDMATNNQPYSLDQWGTFYGYYRVMASKVEIWGTSDTASVTMGWVVFPSMESTVIATNYFQFTTVPYAKQVMVGGITSTKIPKLVNYIGCRKLMGDNSPKYDLQWGAGFSSSSAADPTALMYWHLCIDPINVTLPASFTSSIILKITQYVKLTNRRNLSPSAI